MVGELKNRWAPGGERRLDLMRTLLWSGSFRRVYWIIVIASAALVVNSAGAVVAQVTQAYSFEPDLQGFVGNPPSAAITLSLETSGLGATVGPNSMKVALADFAGFVGAQTANLHTAFTDPLGLDFLRFDLTNTNRFAPPPTDPPTPGVPTFANTSVTFFGEFSSAPGDDASIQFFFSEVPIGGLEPGTHDIEIDLTDGGLWVEGGQIKSYDDYRADGFIPFSFQIYFNKSLRVGDPTFAWTVYVDNIRLGREVAGVPGDHNGDGTVDAADYVAWRKDPNGFGGDPDGYNLWRENFGQPGGTGGARPVPEPTCSVLLIVAGACWWGTMRHSNRQLAVSACL
jgi:hypothetical protein